MAIKFWFQCMLFKLLFYFILKIENCPSLCFPLVLFWVWIFWKLLLWSYRMTRHWRLSKIQNDQTINLSQPLLALGFEMGRNFKDGLGPGQRPLRMGWVGSDPWVGPISQMGLTPSSNIVIPQNSRKFAKYWHILSNFGAIFNQF